VRKVRKIMRVPISLETPIGEEGDSHLGDLIEDRTKMSPAEAVLNVNLKERTAHVLRTLSPREEKIIRMRFGMDDGSEHTLEEVGQSFDVTRERIRQIEAKALRKLRHPVALRQAAFAARRCAGITRTRQRTGRSGQPLGRVRGVSIRQIKLFSTIETDLVGPPFDREDAAQVTVTAAERELEHPTQWVHRSYDLISLEYLSCIVAGGDAMPSTRAAEPTHSRERL
jgi:hypothetical protein